MKKKANRLLYSLFLATIIGGTDYLVIINFGLGYGFVFTILAIFILVRLSLRRENINQNKKQIQTKRIRKPIPQNIKDAVWNRDGGSCVKCGSRYKLEFDHIHPWSKGGTDTYRNLQLLCEPCNRSKSNKI